MRRLIAICATAVLAAVIGAVAVVTAPARSDGGPYRVRAIFDDASYAAIGENVKIAGADVGSITGLGVTDANDAAVTLTIDNSDFSPFFANATCTIRPESLIGDEYVDCSPGTSSARPLARIRSGAGAGEYLLPVTRTSSPINSDIVQDLSTEPVRESLSVILGELGTGLAARGSDLNAVIHRANPALGDTDRVLRILDAQDRTLAQLATSSNEVLAPLAAERRQIAGFVSSANTTAGATAARAADISRTFHEFPSFLAQLRPLMAQLGSLSQQGTPVMTELGSSASALGRQFAQLTPFARSARTALIDLGAAAQRSQGALVASQPLAQRLLTVGRDTRPGATSLAALLESLNSTGGIEQLMSLLYNGVGAGNGFNKIGHYVRAEPITSSCTNYSTAPYGSCVATFPKRTGSSAGSGRTHAATAQTAIVEQALRTTSGAATQSSVSGLLSYLTGGGR